MGRALSTLERAAMPLAVCLCLAAPATARGGFSIVPSPNPGTVNTLGGLVAFSPTTVWAVGATSSSSYAGCHGRTLTARWTGTRFAEVPAPDTAICASVDGVTGTSTRDIWAVGSTSNGRETSLRHWDGASWTVVPGAAIPLPSSGGRQQRSTGLAAAVSLAAGDVWAVGRAQYADFSRRALIEHWDGSAWRLVAGPTASGSSLLGVAAVGPSNLWAVGQAGGGTLIAHYDGSAWRDRKSVV